jgi:hypothetical protein
MAVLQPGAWTATGREALRLDHDLAGRLVRFHVAVRVGDLVQREHPGEATTR